MIAHFLITLLLTGVLGGLSALVMGASLQDLVLSSRKNLLDIDGPNKVHIVAANAAAALAPQRWSQFSYRLFVLSVGFGLMVALSFLPGMDHSFGQMLQQTVGFFCGAVAAASILYRIEWRPVVHNYWCQNAILSAKLLGSLGEPVLALRILREAALQPQTFIRLGAIAGLKELVSLDAMIVLKSLVHDSDKKVVEAAQTTITEMTKLLQGAQPKSLVQLEKLFYEYTLKDNPNHATYGVKQSRIVQLAFLRHEANDLVYSIALLTRAYPHLYCQKCYSAAEQKQFEEWHWVRCKVCKNVLHLVTGVEQVTGQISLENDWLLENGHLRVGLWDNTKHIACNAEITSLEIIGGSTINYEWAVNAVITQLHNHNPAYGKSIRVKLIGNPELSNNTLRLLRELDPLLMNNE